MLDEIDLKLLKSCEKRSGSTLSEVIAPLLKLRARKTLYARLLRLEDLGLVKLDRNTYRGRTLCTITEEGKQALGEHEAPWDLKGSRGPER